jgi:hypothetical protein
MRIQICDVRAGLQRVCVSLMMVLDSVKGGRICPIYRQNKT